LGVLLDMIKMRMRSEAPGAKSPSVHFISLNCAARAVNFATLGFSAWQWPRASPWVSEHHSGKQPSFTCSTPMQFGSVQNCGAQPCASTFSGVVPTQRFTIRAWHVHPSRGMVVSARCALPTSSYLE